MTDADVQRVVHAVITEQQKLLEEAQERIAHAVTERVLVTLGLDEDEPKDIRADFNHLRRWRLSVERVHTIGLTAAIGFIATGFLAALWLGIKASVGKP